MLLDYINYYITELNIIGIASIGNKRSIVIKDDIDEREFIKRIIKNKYDGHVDKKQLISFCNNIGFFSGNKFPERLREKEYYEIYKRTIILKKE